MLEKHDQPDTVLQLVPSQQTPENEIVLQKVTKTQHFHGEAFLDFNVLQFDSSMDPIETKNLFKIESGEKQPNLRRSRTQQCNKPWFGVPQEQSFVSQNQQQEALVFTKNLVTPDPSRELNFCEELEDEEDSCNETLFERKIVTQNQFKRNYEMLQSLGVVEFGEVFQCKNKFDNMIYAVKVIKNHVAQGIEEAQSHAYFNYLHGYEFFLRYYTSWVEDNIVYIVTEYCPKTLKQQISERENFSEEEVVKVLLDVCRGLEKFHKEQRVHLNIRPESILLSENGFYKLSDLGLMKSVEEKQDFTPSTDRDSRFISRELLVDCDPAQIH